MPVSNSRITAITISFLFLVTLVYNADFYSLCWCLLFVYFVLFSIMEVETHSGEDGIINLSFL